MQSTVVVPLMHFCDKLQCLCAAVTGLDLSTVSKNLYYITNMVILT